MKGIMFQGTSSDVGKSMICTAFCRMFSDQGLKVTPFESQNMSNNSYVTVMGEEIGRAQGVQAEAARTIATVDLNPILLKPESGMKSQVILFGKKIETMNEMDYRAQFYETGLSAIDQALSNLAKNFTHIIIEGAGSPAEVNLNDRELVNMTVAKRADVPVVLVADIEHGGVFASIVGTLALIPERERVKGLIINKFRGNARLFDEGIRFLESYTGLPVLGVIPYMDNHEIEQEDSLGVQLHGFFRDQRCRAAFLAPIRKQKGLPLPLTNESNEPLDRWAKHVKDHLDWDRVIEIMEVKK